MLVVKRAVPLLSGLHPVDEGGSTLVRLPDLPESEHDQDHDPEGRPTLVGGLADDWFDWRIQIGLIFPPLDPQSGRLNPWIGLA
jgi:hypothetical protein